MFETFALNEAKNITDFEPSLLPEFIFWPVLSKHLHKHNAYTNRLSINRHWFSATVWSVYVLSSLKHMIVPHTHHTTWNNVRDYAQWESSMPLIHQSIECICEYVGALVVILSLRLISLIQRNWFQFFNKLMHFVIGKFWCQNDAQQCNPQDSCCIRRNYLNIFGGIIADR